MWKSVYQPIQHLNGEYGLWEYIKQTLKGLLGPLSKNDKCILSTEIESQKVNSKERYFIEETKEFSVNSSNLSKVTP